MKIIRTELEKAFDKVKKTGNIYQFAKDIANTTDYSVRFNWQFRYLLDQLNEMERTQSELPDKGVRPPDIEYITNAQKLEIEKRISINEDKEIK